MPTTSRGLTYPASTGHTRLWEWLQTLAQDVDDAFAERDSIAETAFLSGSYTLTTTISDLPGCVITKTTPLAGMKALVTWTADCQLQAAGSTSLSAVINLMVDGVDLAAPQSVWGPGNQAAQPNTRGMVAGSTIVNLAAAGSHTFKLRGAAASATGQIRLNNPYSSISVLILA